MGVESNRNKWKLVKYITTEVALRTIRRGGKEQGIEITEEKSGISCAGNCLPVREASEWITWKAKVLFIEGKLSWKGWPGLGSRGRCKEFRKEKIKIRCDVLPLIYTRPVPPTSFPLELFQNKFSTFLFIISTYI